jgi:hypothetical protein
MVRYYRFADSIGAFEAGQQASAQMAKTRAERRETKLRDEYGSAIETGDYSKAAGLLGRLGQYEPSMKAANQPIERAQSLADFAQFLRTGQHPQPLGQIEQDIASGSFEVSAPQPKQPGPTADMQNYQFARQNGFDGSFVDFRKSGARAEAESRMKPTADMKNYQTARDQGYAGTFMDFQREISQSKKGMTSGDRNAILDAEEAIYSGQRVMESLDKALELNDKALSGYGAKTRAYAGSLVGHDASEAALQLNNIVTSNALQTLKVVFGSMPTEGERKILLEVQGSIDQPPAVRKAIFERAKEAAARRIQFNMQQAEGIRTGNVYQPQQQQMQPGGQANNVPPPFSSPQMPIPPVTPHSQDQSSPGRGGQTSSGLKWSVK